MRGQVKVTAEASCDSWHGTVRRHQAVQKLAPANHPEPLTGDPLLGAKVVFDGGGFGVSKSTRSAIGGSASRWRATLTATRYAREASNDSRGGTRTRDPGIMSAVL